ncbi:ABC transporter transmembrane domain-containing protein [Luedemannella flava]|uniref:ABC transporter transmembrane domain-containing protein n=1 Tax=Luedemannella flava TaxID=349316 RepID=UPI0031D5D08A
MATAALILGASGVNLVVPIAVQQTLDHVNDGTAGPARLTVIVGVIALGAGVLALSALSAFWFNARLARRTETLLHLVRVQAFHTMLTQPEGSAAARSAKVRHAVNDIDRLGRFLRWSGPAMLLNAGQLMIAIAIMIWYSWLLAVVVVLIVTALVCAQRWYRRRAAGAYRAARRRALEMRSAIMAVILRSRQLQAYAARREAQARAQDAADDHSAHQVRLARREAVGRGLNELAAGVLLATVIVAGAFLAARRELTLGQMTALLLVSTVIMPRVEAVLDMLGDGAAALAGWHRTRRRLAIDQPGLLHESGHS